MAQCGAQRWTRLFLGLLWVGTLVATVAVTRWGARRWKHRRAEAKMVLSSSEIQGKASVGQVGFWPLYFDKFKHSKYVDLTHAFEPTSPLWEGFAGPNVSAGLAGTTIEGFVKKGDEWSYADHGFQTTEYRLTTDQLGTQLDPPAHWNELGATISDLPASYSLRQLVVINIEEHVKKDPAYAGGVSDVQAWEAKHGRIPEGGVVFFRSGWSKGWESYKTKGMPAKFPGVSLAALRFLHEDRKILFHGHEPLDTDMTANLEGEAWLLHMNFAQAEGVTNLESVPEIGCLVNIGFAKTKGGTGGYARYVAICPGDSDAHGPTIQESSGAPLPEQKHPLRRRADGVLVPTAGVPETRYCSGKGSLGCRKGAPVWFG